MSKPDMVVLITFSDDGRSCLTFSKVRLCSCAHLVSHGQKVRRSSDQGRGDLVLARPGCLGHHHLPPERQGSGSL